MIIYILTISGNGNRTTTLPSNDVSAIVGGNMWSLMYYVR